MGNSHKFSETPTLYEQKREYELPLDVMKIIALYTSREVFYILSNYWTLTRDNLVQRDEIQILRSLLLPQYEEGTINIARFLKNTDNILTTVVEKFTEAYELGRRNQVSLLKYYKVSSLKDIRNTLTLLSPQANVHNVTKFFDIKIIAEKRNLFATLLREKITPETLQLPLLGIYYPNIIKPDISLEIIDKALRLLKPFSLVVAVTLIIDKGYYNRILWNSRWKELYSISKSVVRDRAYEIITAYSECGHILDKKTCDSLHLGLTTDREID